MSRRNSLQQKAVRRDQRAVRSNAPGFRQRVLNSDINPEARLALLTDPKQKIPRNVRANLLNAGHSTIVVPDKPEPRNQAVKNTLRLAKKPLAWLRREQQRTARRASTAKHTAAQCAIGGKLRRQWELIHDAQLSYFKQINAEIQVRTTPAQGNP